MRTASPWWLSLGLGIGLLFLFMGERLFAHTTGLRGAFTMIGVVLVLGVTAIRAWTVMGASGNRKRVEQVLLYFHLATVAALIVYLFTTSWGLRTLSLSESASVHFAGAATVVFVVLLVVSTVPVLMIELSLGQAMRTTFDIAPAGAADAGVELYRVRDIGWSGLSIALAAGFLMVTCNVANERNIQRDVSYFKTAQAGPSTVAIASSSSEPIRVLLFFPAVNEVKQQVKTYFDDLARQSGGKVVVEEHDRYADAPLAGKYRVTRDGVIVLVRGKDDGKTDGKDDGKIDTTEKSQNLEVDTDIEKARKASGKLRNLDREVNSALLKIVRDKRKAYVMTGHGETNDPDSVPPSKKGTKPPKNTSLFKKRLGELNYEVKDLGLIDLATDVPPDATIVAMLAPTLPLQPAEWDALGRYLDRGGRLLIALDPEQDEAGTLGTLEGKLGLRFDPGDLTDDKAFMPQRGGPSDRRFVITTQFSAHASTTSLSRSVDKGLVLIDAGALEEVPVTGGGTAPTKTMTIRSMETSFLDLNDNFTFDPLAGEKRQRWNIGAAIEGPKMKDADGKDKDGYRALIFSDVDLFVDVKYSNGLQTALVMISGPLLEDSVKWLGGEENYAGEVVSEDDKPIKHTKDQDAKWFTLTILGGPIVVLTFGLIWTWARRKRSQRKKSEVQA